MHNVENASQTLHLELLIQSCLSSVWWRFSKHLLFTCLRLYKWRMSKTTFCLRGVTGHCTTIYARLLLQ